MTFRHWLILLTFPACSAAGYDFNGWSTNGVWTGLRSVTVTAEVWCTTHTATFTNWTATNAASTQTVAWIANVYGVRSNAPDPIVSTWEFPVRIVTTNGLAYSTETRTFTNSLTPTNLVLRNPEIMLIETWYALKERADAIGANAPSSPRLPRYIRDDTIIFKNWITNNATRFVNRACYTNDTFTNWVNSGGDWWHPPMVPDSDTLAAMNSLPTNYFQYTPARETIGLGVGIGRIVTTSWRIATSAAGIVTQTTVNACGDTVAVAGTNGQYVSAICTNDEIQAGFTSLDYGLSRIQVPINFLAWTTSSTTYGSSEWRRVQGPSDTEATESTLSWTIALETAGRAWTNQADEAGDLTTNKTWRYSDGNDLLPRRNTSGQGVLSATNLYLSSSLINAWITGFHTVLTTNYAHEADLFMSRADVIAAGDDTPYNVTETCYTVDTHGLTLTTNLLAIASTNLTALSIDWPTIGDNSNTVPDWTTAPSTGGCSATARGYAADRAAWLIRWDVPSGFRFKGD